MSDMGSWFSTLDPATQWELMYGSANDTPSSMNAGGMAPELSPWSFDATTMATPLPEMTSKGRVLPVDVDTRKKQLGVIHAQNSAMMEPLTAMLGGDGSYDPSLFQSQFTGVGDPISRPGHTLLESYQGADGTGGGGYEGFIAKAILGGKNPSSAMADMMQMITSKPTGDPAADGARDALIASLTPRYDTNQIPGQVSKPDLTTPAGVASAYDLKGIQDWSRGLYEKMLTDPQQGMRADDNQYYKSLKEEKTPAQAYFDKNMLPYPTASYLDPERLSPFLDSVAPVDQTEVANWDQNRDTTAAAVTSAKSASDHLAALQKAWDTSQSTDGGENGAFASFSDYTAPTTKMQVPMIGTGLPASLNKVVDIVGKTPTHAPAPWVEVDSQGNISLSGEQFYKPPTDGTGVKVSPTGTRTSKTDGGMDATLPADFGAKGAPGKAPPSRRQMTKDDLAKMQQQRAMLQRNLGEAVSANSKANVSPQGLGARAYQLAKMQNVAETGRTPLKDALAQRMMTARNQGVYG